MKYKVQKTTTPPPPINRGRPADKNSLRGQIRLLEVNQCLTVTDKDIRHVSATASQIAKALNRKITTRSQENGTVKVWRTQ